MSTFTFAPTCQIFREKDGFFIYNVTTPHYYPHSVTSTINFKSINQIFHPLQGVVPIICRGLHTSRRINNQSNFRIFIAVCNIDILGYTALVKSCLLVLLFHLFFYLNLTPIIYNIHNISQTLILYTMQCHLPLLFSCPN